MGFKLFTSSPYYAQANGQVKAVNKVVIGLIKNTWGRSQGIGIRHWTEFYERVEPPPKRLQILSSFD